MSSSSHGTFKKAAGLMLVAVLLSRILGLVRDMLIARQFGQTGVVSAYNAAFNLPDLLYFFLSSGALSSAFIPVFSERFRTGREKEAWQIFSIIACFMGVVLTVMIILAWIFARPLVSIFAMPGQPELVPLTTILTKIILPCQLFFFLGGLMMGTLESRQKFSARAAGPVIYNMGIIFGAIVFNRWFHISGLAYGALIGAFAGNVVYTFYCLKREGFHFYPSLNIRHPGVVKVAQLALPVILGLSLPQIDIIVNKWFATFVSATATAELNNANRLMQVPLGIFAQAAGTAILPMLAAYAARNAFDEMRSGIGYGLRSILVENIPATLFMIVMADPLVRTIYMGGEFHPSDVSATVIPLIWYSMGIFAWAGQAIVARGFFALQDTKTPVVIGTVSTIIFVPLNYFLMHLMGTAGIALSTTIAAIIHFLALTYFLRKRLNGIEGTKTLKAVGRIIVAAAVMAVICVGVRYGMAKVVGTWQLQDGDIRRPAVFALELQHSSAPISKQLYSDLSKNTRDQITANETVATLEPLIKRSLQSELNDIIRSDGLYTKKRFEDITLTGTTETLVDNHSRKSLLRMNRGLIEAAYPDSIVKITDLTAWERFWQSSNKRVSNGDSNWEIVPVDFRDVRLLASELMDKKNPVSVYIVSQLSDATRSTLRDYHSCCHKSEDFSISVMHDINTAIRTEHLSNAASSASGKPLAEYNRRLLEATYPGQIVVRSPLRVESKLGSILTIIVAMLLGGTAYLLLLRLMKVDELDFIWSAIRRRISRKPAQKSA